MGARVLESFVFDAEKKVFEPSEELKGFYFELFSRIAQRADKFGNVPTSGVTENLEGLMPSQAARALNWLGREGYIGSGYRICPTTPKK